MQKKVNSLSGGERAKLALCVLECEKGNVLLLDEPTNHLDLPAREGLETALKKFDGTLIFVSHDRYFISALADKIAEIENCSINFFDGGYAAFNDEKKKKSEVKNIQPQVRNAYHRSGKERAEAERNKQKIKALESRIAELENSEKQINLQLADTEIISDYLKVNELVARLEGIKLQLDKLYNEYGEMI